MEEEGQSIPAYNVRFKTPDSRSVSPAAVNAV